jgi:hypothetical protein
MALSPKLPGAAPSVFAPLLVVLALPLGGCGSPECSPGTVDEDGKCVAVRCGPGSVDRDGVCTPTCLEPFWVEREGGCVLRDADVSEPVPDDNDPDRGGTAIPIGLPAAGTTLFLGGEIGVPTPDGYDTDVYEFDARAGQVIRVEALGDGASALAFEVLPKELTPSSFIWYGFAFAADHPSRYIRFATDETFYLRVTDQANLDGESIEGGSRCDYRVGITLLPAAEDTRVLADVPVDVDLLGPPVVLKTSDLSADTLYTIDVPAPARTSYRSLNFLDDAGRVSTSVEDLFDDLMGAGPIPIGTQHFNAVRFMGAEKRFVFDYRLWFDNPSVLPVTVRAVPVEDLGDISETSNARAPLACIASYNGTDLYRFHATKSADARFMVVRLVAENQVPVLGANLYLYDDQFRPVRTLATRVRGMQTLWGQLNAVDLLVEADGTYYVEVSEDVWPTQWTTPMTYDLSVESIGQVEVTFSESTGDNGTPDTAEHLDLELPANAAALVGSLDSLQDVDVFQFTAREAADVVGMVLPTDNEPTTFFPHFTLLDESLNVVCEAMGDLGFFTGSTFGPGAYEACSLPAAGTYYLQVSGPPYSSDANNGFGDYAVVLLPN